MFKDFFTLLLKEFVSFFDIVWNFPLGDSGITFGILFLFFFLFEIALGLLGIIFGVSGITLTNIASHNSPKSYFHRVNKYQKKIKEDLSNAKSDELN